MKITQGRRHRFGAIHLQNVVVDKWKGLSFIQYDQDGKEVPAVCFKDDFADQEEASQVTTEDLRYQLGRFQRLIDIKENEYEWPYSGNLEQHLISEVKEFMRALDESDCSATDEMGDIVGTVLYICHVRGINPVVALHDYCCKMERMLDFINANRRGCEMRALKREQRKQLWNDAKDYSAGVKARKVTHDI